MHEVTDGKSYRHRTERRLDAHAEDSKSAPNDVQDSLPKADGAGFFGKGTSEIGYGVEEPEK